MIHGFDTDDPHAAAGAMLVYAAWRSRDKRRFKITPDVWGQVERFVKSAAKRAPTLAGFLDRLLPRLAAATVDPRYCGSDLAPLVQMERLPDGSLIERAAGQGRVFPTRLLAEADAAQVLRRLQRETVLVILLVRERLERERPLERRLDAEDPPVFQTLDDLRTLWAADDAQAPG